MKRGLTAGLMIGVMLLTSCSGEIGQNQPGNGSSQLPGKAKIKFPQFSNAISYEPGGKIPKKEEYLNYNAYIQSRFEYADMKYHWAEVAADRLAENGIFEKSTNFEPDKTVTVTELVKYLLKMAKVKVNEKKDADILNTAKKYGLIHNGEFDSYDRPISREELALIVSRSVKDALDLEQYQLLIGDYNSIDDGKKAGVVKAVGLGILNVSGGKLMPKEKATRAEVADALYKAQNPGMRNVMPYDLGSAYQEGKNSYLVKSVMETNPSGIQFGFWSMYNWQQMTYTSFGKRPIDRVDFHTWASMETSKGMYDFGSFANSIGAHKAGSTIITSINLSANKIWNPAFKSSNIPDFYPQDITDKATRTAAKQFLFSYTQTCLNAVGGDILLSIDYEIDWQMDFMSATAESQRRARIWADWYVEACEVARSAAKAMGASDRLKLIVIYNYATELHKLGPEQNGWMLDVAKASDYIGLDTYGADKNDRTNPSVTLESIRFLVNNYTLGKPFIVVENGFNVKPEQAKAGFLIGTAEEQNLYFQRLYREFDFELGAGGFLNNNLRGFLHWCLRDEDDGKFGMLDVSGNEKEVAKTVRAGIQRMEGRKQFAPSIVKSIEEIRQGTAVPISVQSGTQYNKLTYLVTDLADTKPHTLILKLKNAGTAMLNVNGTVYYPKVSLPSKSLTFTINEGLKEGFNYIDIYFGSIKTPFHQEVKSVSFK